MTLTQNPPSLHAYLDDFEHGINRIAVTSDGKLYATSDVDMNVRVFEGETLLFKRNFSTPNEKIKPTERIRGLAFSPKGDTIFVAAGESVSAIRLSDGRDSWTYVAPRSFGFLIISPLTLDVSEHGDVVVAFDNGSVAVWSLDGEMKAKWHDNDSPRTIRFLLEGESVVGTDSFSLCVWNIAKRKRKMKLGLSGRVYAMDVRRCGTIVAARTLQDVVVWDIVERDILCVIPVEPGIPILALHPHEKWVACGERDQIKLADFNGNILAKFPLNATCAISLAFTPDGKELLVGCTQGQLIRIAIVQ